MLLLQRNLQLMLLLPVDVVATEEVTDNIEEVTDVVEEEKES